MENPRKCWLTMISSFLLLLTDTLYAAELLKSKSDRMLFKLSSSEQSLGLQKNDEVILVAPDDDEFQGFVRSIRGSRVWIQTESKPSGYEKGENFSIESDNQADNTGAHFGRPDRYRFGWDLEFFLGSQKVESESADSSDQSMGVFGLRALYGFSPTGLRIGLHLKSLTFSEESTENTETTKVSYSLTSLGPTVGYVALLSQARIFVLGSYTLAGSATVKAEASNFSAESSQSATTMNVTVGADWLLRQGVYLGAEYQAYGNIKVEGSEDALSATGLAIRLGFMI